MLNPSDISDVLKMNGISSGDNIFLHVDAIVTNFIEGNSSERKIDNLIDGIINLIGPSGTLVLPTFTYSATKNKIYDPLTTPSQSGIITESFRNRKDVLRSYNPIFSVASYGNMAEKIQNSNINDCFGDMTCFDLIYKYNFWIITMGCSFDRVAFIHYVDQYNKVSYRNFIKFNSIILKDSKKINSQIQFFARDLNRDSTVKLDQLRDRLYSLNLLRKDSIGRIGFLAVKSNDFFNVASEMINEQENIHIKEGNNEI